LRLCGLVVFEAGETAALVAESAGFADAITEEIEFGPAGVGPTNNFDLGDARRIEGKDSFDPLIGDDSPNGDGLVDSATSPGDEHTLEDLDTFLVAFDDSYMNINGVADGYHGEIGFELIGYDFFE